MANTEELEAQILAEMESNPEAYADTGTEYCTVDDDTRLVTIPEKYKKLGTESDEKAKRVWFRFPKIVGNNGIDLSAISVRVNFRNANGDGDIYIVEDLTTDGDFVIFSWELTRKVTAYKWNVSFVVCAVKSATDGTTKNEWNTTLNKECEVLEGLEVTEQINQENPDIIEYILANLGGSVSAEQIAKAVEEYMQKNPQANVSYEPQELTEEQKVQARKNIDAASEFICNITTADSGATYTCDQTYSDALAAHNAGKNVVFWFGGLVVPATEFTSPIILGTYISNLEVVNVLLSDDDTIVTTSTAIAKSSGYTAGKNIVTDKDGNLVTEDKPKYIPQVEEATDGHMAVFDTDGTLLKDGGEPPKKLPNPQKLIFSGAVTAEYDGSGAVTVTIPESSGGSGGTVRIEKLSTDTAVGLEPNKLYIFPEMEELTITLAEPTDTAVASEYHFVFQSGATATTLSLPDTIKLPSGFTVDASKIYEISILEGCLCAQSWAVA